MLWMDSHHGDVCNFCLLRGALNRGRCEGVASCWLAPGRYVFGLARLLSGALRAESGIRNARAVAGALRNAALTRVTFATLAPRLLSFGFVFSCLDRMTDCGHNCRMNTSMKPAVRAVLPAGPPIRSVYHRIQDEGFGAC